jgi:hypothetical protein
MCPSIEVTEVQREFAADVLRDLLRRIDVENSNEGRYTFLVSHAWTAGPMIHVVFTAPPSDKTWGLVRDTRTSIIDPGPWPDLDEAVSYYYLLDFEENWPGRFSRKPGEPDTIQWSGDRHAGLPEHPADIPETHRYMPSPDGSSVKHDAKPGRHVGNEPRRYTDPR